MNIETVDTGIFTMDYIRFGRGKETLVILPGLSVQSVMLSAKAVAAAYESLTEDFTVYVFDRRKVLPSAYSVREMARDTIAAIKTLKLVPVCLFGASQGGMMALEIAIEEPSFVRRMVLGSSAARLTAAHRALFESWIGLARAGDAAGLYLAFGESLYPPTVFEQFRELLTETARTVTAEELRRFICLAEATFGFDVTNELDRILCPVLVIGSKDDRVLGADASIQIAEHFKARPDCALYLYDGYGHAAYDTAPDYKERLRQFLASDSKA